ncbi:homocysteine S-methyltransferase family protein [Primorskyibacter flagellatus]|uniref:Homocysteine S-methyltransferase n=1 Tax=Primorskyibacter flagellatus TaxID=1387277 RepID=A0A1W2AP78_9RHOB|nr:homocysteine S-methyltransferase family protein [Primorskyibacter flagellatus]SMC62495.1 homocysteine S-methyltransferase [Primorskyibacter flagellatus]
MKQDVTLLDGSIGQELVIRSAEPPTPLWSTSVMVEHPQLLRELHDAYFNAGATVATTNSYPVVADRLRAAGIEDQLDALLHLAAGAAVSARDAHGAGRVAGALGPLAASYRPDLCPPASEAAKAYRPTVAGLAPFVDLFIAETMSSVDQADGALRAIARSGKPAWLALSVMDEDGTRLRSGEQLEEVASIVARHAPQAVLINCTRPESVAPALEVLRGFGMPFGAFANGFVRIAEAFLQDRPTVDVLQDRVDLTPAAYADFAMGWVDQGASIVGGCCEVGPAHIAELAMRLRTAGHRIV